MLVLSRQKKQALTITDGTETITVRVLRSGNTTVRLGIDAPGRWKIVREELEAEGDGEQSGSEPRRPATLQVQQECDSGSPDSGRVPNGTETVTGKEV